MDNEQSGWGRRRFLRGGLALAAGAAAGTAWGQGEQKFDLLIKGGEVLDPSQKLRAVRDVAIRLGAVAAVEPDIAAERALRVIDAKGKLVTPGLVDYHTHVFPYGSAMSVPPDEIVPNSGTTTYVSAGDAGGGNFAAFRKLLVGPSRSRLFAYVNISSIGLTGFPVGEAINIDHVNVDLAARTLAENADIGLGIKVRETLAFVGQNGIEPLRRAILATERSGVKGARVMCHIGNAPGDLSTLLDLLRPGDVLTHPYSALGNNTVQAGKLLPAVLEAKKRGVLIDVGHGAGSFNFAIAEEALRQGLTPDTISSDVSAAAANTPSKPYLPWVLSKFLALGFTLEQVIAAATVVPGRLIGKVPGLGTLQPGAPGDVSILELVEGPVTLLDTQNQARQGKAFLRAVQTVRAGVPFGAPYPIPFSVS
jgi:dihydroorotase